jgi:hypothetical protein
MLRGGGQCDALTGDGDLRQRGSSPDEGAASNVLRTDTRGPSPYAYAHGLPHARSDTRQTLKETSHRVRIPVGGQEQVSTR